MFENAKSSSSKLRICRVISWQFWFLSIKLSSSFREKQDACSVIKVEQTLKILFVTNEQCMTRITRWEWICLSRSLNEVHIYASLHNLNLSLIDDRLFLIEISMQIECTSSRHSRFLVVVQSRTSSFFTNSHLLLAVEDVNSQQL